MNIEKEKIVAIFRSNPDLVFSDRIRIRIMIIVIRNQKSIIVNNSKDYYITYSNLFIYFYVNYLYFHIPIEKQI